MVGYLLVPASAQSSMVYVYYHFIALGGLEHSKACAVPWRRDEKRKSGLVYRGYRRKNLIRSREEDQQVEQQRRRQASCTGVHETPRQWGDSALSPLGICSKWPQS